MKLKFTTFLRCLLIYILLSTFSSSFSQGSGSYLQVKQEISQFKNAIGSAQILEDSISAAFAHLISTKLIPHWLTTPWSFEGHTTIPREGTIACSYFVSTTLLDMGLNINRFKMAQQLPIHEAKTLALGLPLIEIYNPAVQERIDTLTSLLNEGIYFIGFDQSHVGYIQRKNDELFVIHSNFIGAVGVVIESIGKSEVFGLYDHIYISPISSNRELMLKWVDGTRIDVVTNEN